jgi:hypothetical protein
LLDEESSDSDISDVDAMFDDDHSDSDLDPQEETKSDTTVRGKLEGPRCLDAFCTTFTYPRQLDERFAAYYARTSKSLPSSVEIPVPACCPDCSVLTETIQYECTVFTDHNSVCPVLVATSRCTGCTWWLPWNGANDNQGVEHGVFVPPGQPGQCRTGYALVLMFDLVDVLIARRVVNSLGSEWRALLGRVNPFSAIRGGQGIPTKGQFIDHTLHFLHHVEVYVPASDHHTMLPVAEMVCPKHGTKPEGLTLDGTPLKLRHSLLSSAFYDIGTLCGHEACKPTVPRTSVRDNRCLFSDKCRAVADMVFGCATAPKNMPSYISEEACTKLLEDVIRHRDDVKTEGFKNIVQQAMNMCLDQPREIRYCLDESKKCVYIGGDFKPHTVDVTAVPYSNVRVRAFLVKRKRLAPPYIERSPAAQQVTRDVVRGYLCALVMRAASGFAPLSCLVPFELARCIKKDCTNSKDLWVHHQSLVFEMVHEHVYELMACDAEPDRSLSGDLWNFLQCAADVVYGTSTAVPQHNMCSHAPQLPGETLEEKWLLSGFYSCVGDGLPLRKRRTYAIDSTGRGNNNGCSKKWRNATGWTGGLFVGTCSCGFPYAAGIMKNAEGRHHLFEFITAFYALEKDPLDDTERLERLRTLCYDFACNACEYCLNREPVRCRYIRFYIDM